MKFGIRERMILISVISSLLFLIGGILIYISGSRISSLAVSYGILIDIKVLMQEMTKKIEQAVKFSAPMVLSDAFPLLDEMKVNLERIKGLGVDIRKFEEDFGKFRGVIEQKRGLSEFSSTDISELSDMQLGLSEGFTAMTENYSRKIERLVTFQNLTILAVVFFSISVISALGLFYAFQIHKNINDISKRLEEIYRGGADLTRLLSYAGEDEIGELCSNFNLFVGKLRNMINQISEVAGKVDRFVEKTFALTEKFSSSIADQFQEFSRISTAAEEFSSAISESTNNLSGIANTTSESYSIFLENSKTISSSLQIIQGLVGKLSEVLAEISKIDIARRKIEGFVSSIKDITDQTNLLALNASIEAARAGEHGKGFAIVADEVRKLASKTFQLAKEISASIATFGSIISKTMENISMISDSIDRNIKAAAGGMVALEKIQKNFSSIKDQINSIASAFSEQERAGREISRSITHVSAILDESKKKLEDLKTMIRDLKDQSDTLISMVRSFKG